MSNFGYYVILWVGVEIEKWQKWIKSWKWRDNELVAVDVAMCFPSTNYHILLTSFFYPISYCGWKNSTFICLFM